MLTIWDWCSATFGKDNGSTWDASFADSSDDWVKFIFYDDKLGTMFRLVYPEFLPLEEFEMIKWRLE
jgi:hypothetical protein